MSNYSDKLEEIRHQLEQADAIVVGIGAGLSAASGMSYSCSRFMEYFSDFHEKYGIEDMYSGGFYPFNTLEEYWAWWSRHIYYNRYDVPVGRPYRNLLEVVKDKNYFILTTNVDIKSSGQESIKTDFFIHKEITAYGSALHPVIRKTTIMKQLLRKW